MNRKWRYITIVKKNYYRTYWHKTFAKSVKAAYVKAVIGICHRQHSLKNKITLVTYTILIL